MLTFSGEIEMNIFNNKPRKILCIRNDKDGMMKYCHNHHLLEIGKEYTFSEVIVYPWHTEVYLEEFPKLVFNSVMFKEIE